MTAKIELTDYELLGLSIFKSLSNNSIQSPSRFIQLFFIEATNNPSIKTPKATLTENKTIKCETAEKVLKNLHSNGLISSTNEDNNFVYKLTYRGHAICSSIRCKKAILAEKLQNLTLKELRSKLFGILKNNR
jgi:predicted transcriptional regulator